MTLPMLLAAPLSATLVLTAPIPTWRATVARVIDGDTIVARVTLWPRVEQTATIRVLGIDARKSVV